MRVFVTGANGQLGQDVISELSGQGHEIIASGRQTSYGGRSECRYICLDITNQNAVAETVEMLRPDAVIHCAAWTAVDAAEDAEEDARAVNAEGTRYLAEACKKSDAKLLYVSTDYVFDGSGAAPWQPDCEFCAPLNVYGKTKLEGERAVIRTMEKYFIVRTSWVFGAHGRNFLQTMLDAGKRLAEVRVVNDQVGTPTYTCDLARLLADMIETEKYGCYHAANAGGFVSRYDLCRELYRQAGLQTKVTPVSSAEYGAARAARPLNSRLDTSKLAETGFKPLPDWKDAIRRYLSDRNAAPAKTKAAHAVPVQNAFFKLSSGQSR